jgi:uncharacterized protein YkwD
MGSLYATTVLLMAHLAVESPETLVSLRKPLLHEHPTIVQMCECNNELRAQVGLPPQELNLELTRAAQDHAVYMARTGSFSHHSNLGPMGRAAKFGFRGPIRENIAMGQRGIRSAFQSWRNSSGHWANITSRTTHCGFGYAVSAQGSGYWVAVYGNADGSVTTVRSISR